MIRLYSWIILLTLGVIAQETVVYRNVPTTLRECYESKYLLEKDYRLPHTLNTLIAILQKIEKDPESSNKDLRTLTVGIMHRFRQDGIEKNPFVVEQAGVLPYKAGRDSQKYVQIARFIPERTDNNPSYNMITDVERCTLHFMLSSSTEIFQRGDENMVCKYADNAYRIARSATGNRPPKANLEMHDDVETLSPEQIDVITNNKHGVTEFDPNSMYPELPPNHPKVARYLVEPPPLSKCPVENGVIKTVWGPVSAGSLIAGIAAGLQPQVVSLSELFPEEKDPDRKSNLSRLSLDNKWIATIAGDLAEVTLIQGPTTNGPKNNKLSIGVNGMWNSSAMPRWYFLKSNEKLQFTTAEIRGDIDGLILASQIEALNSKVSRLRLSQVLDLYYNPRGLFNPAIRACNRRTFFETEISKETMAEQAFSSSLVLEEYLHKATISDDKMRNFAKEAMEELARYVGGESMSKDLSCQDTETGFFNDVVQPAIDLTIILDTSWHFNEMQPILAEILDNIKIGPYNSQFRIMNGRDGSVMLNTTDSILDFGYYNMTNYTSGLLGFELPKALEKLRPIQTKKLNDERSGFGNAKSDVVLVMPFTTSLSESDKQYCIEKLKDMREKVPDATLLILTYGSKDRWAELVRDPVNDLFSTTAGDIGGAITIANLISRIKQVPQRLINTKCGANYQSAGSTNSFINYIEPGTVAFYRIHPNYFFSTDSDHSARIKIEGAGWGNLRVCTARRSMNINQTGSSCKTINNDAHSIQFSCGDAGLIHLCDPMYLSITATTTNASTITNFQCTDPLVCRFPHMIKYTISYENLVCESNASISMLNIFVLFTSMIYMFF